MQALPSYNQLKLQFPLSSFQNSFINESRKIIRNILNGHDPRLLLIIGPCSIHDPLSAIDFAIQLKELTVSISDHFYCVMRTYCEKPRTTSGWKGYLYDPYLDGSNDILAGIAKTRKLLLDLADIQIPTATEFLDPLTCYYYEDLISWGSIGARTSSSQTHRQLASDLTIPIGFKNGVAGNLSAAINGVISAQTAHTFMGLNDKGLPIIKKTLGNQDGHVVLRGGDNGPNFEAFWVSETVKQLEKHRLPKRLIIDCSHQNSGKSYNKQPFVFQAVLDQIRNGNRFIKGLMLESHLFEGNQVLKENPSELNYGVSITDECLGWNSTRELILQQIPSFNSCEKISFNRSYSIKSYAEELINQNS